MAVHLTGLPGLQPQRPISKPDRRPLSGVTPLGHPQHVPTHGAYPTWPSPRPLNRPGFVGGYDALASGMIIVCSLRVSHAFSYSAGGTFPQAEWSRVLVVPGHPFRCRHGYLPGILPRALVIDEFFLVK